MAVSSRIWKLLDSIGLLTSPHQISFSRMGSTTIRLSFGERLNSKHTRTLSSGQRRRRRLQSWRALTFWCRGQRGCAVGPIRSILGHWVKHRVPQVSQDVGVFNSKLLQKLSIGEPSSGSSDFKHDLI